jgi:hypothetical protein
MKAAVILVTVGMLLAGLAATAPAAAIAQQPMLWTGVQWQQVSEDGKAGYIFGMGNLADFEVASAGNRKPACISRAFVSDLKTMTVMQIIQEVDAFYREHPDKLNTSVIEVVLRRCTKLCPPETPKGVTKK